MLADFLPKSRDEAFKYTSFAALARRDYEPPTGQMPDVNALPAHEGARLCFVDGRFIASLSKLDGLDIQTGTPAVMRKDGNALFEMNRALADQGLTLAIPEDSLISSPIEILMVASEHEKAVAANTRLRITLGPRARACIIERHISLGKSADFFNLVMELQIAESAKLTWVTDQRCARAVTLATGLYVHLGDHAHFESHAIHLGCSLVRSDIDIILAGRGGYASLSGLHMPGMRQHIDTHSRIQHQVPDTTSHEHYRAIVDRGGRSVFNGKVVVSTGADRTDAHQFNANLLLSEQAEADTKPELEIYADDVKCSHGATVGKLDETALFYLRSRGIGEDAARSVLVWAFADTVLTNIPGDALRQAIEDEVLSRLPDAERIREFR